MKWYFTLLYLVLSISLCSSTATTKTPGPGPTSLVPALCKDLEKADPTNIDYEFCVSRLESDPRSSKSTAPQVGDISFQMSIAKANYTSSFFNVVLGMPKLSQPAKKVLEGCSNLYLEILGQLEAGQKALRDGDYRTANDEVKTALVAAETCGREIKGSQDIAHFGKMNDGFYQLASISLGFTKLLRIVN